MPFALYMFYGFAVAWVAVIVYVFTLVARERELSDLPEAFADRTAEVLVQAIRRRLPELPAGSFGSERTNPAHQLLRSDEFGRAQRPDPWWISTVPTRSTMRMP